MTGENGELDECIAPPVTVDSPVANNILSTPITTIVATVARMIVDLLIETFRSFLYFIVIFFTSCIIMGK